jgi:ParB family chromosome partitioning protein
MEILDIPLDRLRAAPWNPNEADAATLRRLAASLGRFGTVLPLVVRPLDDAYEVIGGNQRLRVYREQGVATAPCVEVQADDVQARLLAQALNAVHGQDDLNKKAALVRELLAAMDAEEVAAILPDGVAALRGLASLGPGGADLGAQLAQWAATEAAKAQAKLHVTSFPFSDAQKALVEDAIGKALAVPAVARYEGPNRRAAALVHIAHEWAAGRGYRPGRGRRGNRPVVSAAATPPHEEA